GFRVLALAWKRLGSILDDFTSLPTSQIKKPLEVVTSSNAWLARYQNLSRVEMETDLEYLGLVVLDNPVKKATAPTIHELQAANLRVIMATETEYGSGLTLFSFTRSRPDRFSCLPIALG
ncbi:unnamed protein product, partial [Protopolystoma xenopodis]